MGEQVIFPSNIKEYPQKKTIEDSKITFGDMHGNALMLLHNLILAGIIDISPRDYAWFVNRYEQAPDSLTKADYAYFDHIIEHAHINKDKALCFLGDLFADRGSNDYFTLKILHQLVKSEVNYEIILSNHDAEFIINYELYGLESLTKSTTIDDNFTHSYQQLNATIRAEKVDKNKVHTMVKEALLSRIKPLGWDKSNHDFTIYSHAPINLTIIKQLAQQLGIQRNIGSDDDLMETLESINAQIFKSIQRGELHSLLASLNNQMPRTQGIDSLPALVQLLWNRDYSQLNQDEGINGIEILYVHGHDHEKKGINERYFCLDGILGKSSNAYQGELLVFTANGFVIPSEKLYTSHRVTEAECFVDDKDDKLFVAIPRGNKSYEFLVFQLTALTSDTEIIQHFSQRYPLSIPLSYKALKEVDKWRSSYSTSSNSNKEYFVNYTISPSNESGLSKLDVDISQEKNGESILEINYPQVTLAAGIPQEQIISHLQQLIKHLPVPSISQFVSEFRKLNENAVKISPTQDATVKSYHARPNIEQSFIDFYTKNPPFFEQFPTKPEIDHDSLDKLQTNDLPI